MKGKYTCNDYREEMILLGLKRRLALEKLDENEKKEIIEQIKKNEKAMGLDE